MNDKDEDRNKWNSIRIIKENLSTDNWVTFNEQFILVVAKHNKDVYTLITTGKAPKWKLPTMDDTRPVINIDTGEIVLDGHGVVAREKVFKNDEVGKEDFKFKMNTMRKRIQAYEDAITPCIVTLIQHIEDPLMRVMKLDKDKYTKAYDEDDIVTLYALARFASTGQGADSLYIDLVRMSTIKVENGDWVKFTYLFQELRKRILGSSVSKEEIIEKFFDALFIIRSGEGVRALEKLVGEIMCMKEWPTADKCISVWNTMLTTKKNLDIKTETEKKEGALSANMSTLQSQIKTLQEQVSSYGSTASDLQALYTKSPGEISNIICHNCGKKGHGKKRCRLPPAKCNNCGEQHITSQHDSVMRIQKRVNSSDHVERKWTNTSNTKQAHVADLTYDDDPEDTIERQIEDEIEEYKNSMSRFEDIDDTASSYGNITKLSNFNVTICQDGVGIEVEEPLTTTVTSTKHPVDTTIPLDKITMKNKGKVKDIPTMREVIIDDSEYHYLSDDDEDVIETIIPEYTEAVKTTVEEKTMIIDDNNDSIIVRIVRNVVWAMLLGIYYVICGRSKKVVHTKKDVSKCTTNTNG